MSIVTEALAHAVGDFGDICVTGGGTRSELGLRLRAALTGRRLHIMKQQEAVCLGTAILAGFAVGEYQSIEQAVAGVVAENNVVVPDQAMAESYRDQMQEYKWLRTVAVQHA